MRARFRRSQEPTDIRLNLTALVDATVLLLTFFMMVNSFASAERVEMEVPRPDASLARDRRVPEPVVVNVLYRGPDEPPGYQLGPLQIDLLSELAARLAVTKRHMPQLEVILRADRRLRYEEVREVMELLGDQGISRLHIVAEVESDP